MLLVQAVSEVQRVVGFAIAADRALCLADMSWCQIWICSYVSVCQMPLRLVRLR